MTPDRHDREVAAHLQREDANQARRDALRATVIERLTQRYWETFRTGGDGWEFFCDELTTAPEPVRIQLFAAGMTDDQTEAGRVLKRVHEAACQAFIHHFEDREFDRLMEAA